MRDDKGLLRRHALLALSAAAFSAAAPAACAQSAKSAEATLDHERALAAAEGKGVLLVFFASWCGWCRLLDATLAEPEAQDLIAPRFRILHMRVRERRPDMLAQQLAGVDDLVTRLGGGREIGVPYFVFLNADGHVLASSVVDGANIGFPVTNEELAAFDAMLARSAPDMSATDRGRLRAALVRHAPA